MISRGRGEGGGRKVGIDIIAVVADGLMTP